MEKHSSGLPLLRVEFSELATTRLVARKNGTFQDHAANASIFLSGNGPLVAVLKNALGRGSNNIQDVRKYVQHHESGDKRIPLHHVIILTEPSGLDKTRSSVGTKARSWAMNRTCSSVWQTVFRLGAVVGLIAGSRNPRWQESGLQQWVDAVQHSTNWDIHAPGIVEQLNTGEIQVFQNLTSPQHHHSVAPGKLHHWVDGVLGHVETPYEDLQDMYESLKRPAKIYLTSSLRKAKMYLWTGMKSPERATG